TRSSKGRRRSHHQLKKQTLTVCKHCDSVKQPHRLCVNCQKY
ncbi:MAG: 50S ribosomal protein L32, partial [Candidatus Jacksonbacteria bacterium]